METYHLPLNYINTKNVALYFSRIELEIQNTSLLNPAQDAHRRQTGVSDENDEEGCEDEIVQPGGMECGYATLHHLSRVSWISHLIPDFLRTYA